MVMLVVTATTPFAGVVLFGAQQHFARERSQAEAMLVVQASALALALDRKAGEIVALEEVLATLSAPAFERATAAARGNHSYLTISIVDDLGRPDVPPPSTAPAVRFTSPLVVGDVHSPALAFETRATLAGRGAVTLFVGIGRERLQRILADSPKPDGWITAFDDQLGRVVARNVRSDVFVGTNVIQPIREALASRTEGFVRTRNVEGVESSIAFARAPRTGFSAAIAIPSEMFDAPRRAALLHVIEAALFVMLGAGALAFMFARQISNSLRRVADDLVIGREPRAGFWEIANLAGALGSVVRQRDETLADLVRQKSNLRGILDALPLSIMVTDHRLELSFVNARARADFGDVKLKTPKDRDAFIHPADGDVIRAWRAALLAGEKPCPVRVRYSIRGAYRWHLVDCVVTPPHASNGETFVATLLDIHDAHEAREALAEANVDLELRVAKRTRELAAAACELTAELSRREQLQAELVESRKQEALGRLTGGAAHDVNNVLAVISNSYEAIERATSQSALREGTAMGREAVAHAAALLRRLMAFARRHPLSPITIATAPTLKEMTAFCRHALGAGFTLAARMDDNLPPLRIDREMLQAALLNLVVNACESMPAGGPVTLEARQVFDENGKLGGDLEQSGAGRVAISVRDAGCGMTAEQISRATEPFYTTKADAGSAGLGLAMVDGFVAQSGGRLRMQSLVGEGTIATTFLPIHETTEPRPADPVDRERLEHEARGGTVLVVDDNAALLRSTSLLLSTCGFTVIEAPDARSAFDLVERRPDIELVYTDIAMPNERGTELADRLAILRPDLPVIFVTGFAGDDAATRGRVVLRKPVDLGVMLAAFDAALSAETSECRGVASDDQRG